MIFILNKQEKVVNILRNGGGANKVPPFFDDIYSQNLATGAETFTFSTVAINNVVRDLVVGNYVAFKNDEGEYKLFQITQTEEYHEDAMYMNVYAEGAGLELINKVFRARKSPSTSLRKFMEMVLNETGWNVGTIPLSVQESIDLDLEDATVYATLQNTLSKYGVEMAFRCEINNGRISSKFVDLYIQRGRVTGKRFAFGRDIEGIRRKVDSTELFTALIGRGNKDISFKDVTVDGINKPLGQDFVADQEAYDKYNNNGYHITGIFSYDTDSPEELLRETYKQLQKCKEPKIEYEVSVALLGELLGESWNRVSIGDTVAIVDNAFNPPIHLMARVSKLDKSFTNNQSDTCTLSNFVEVKSNISDSMRKIASQLEGYIESKFPIGSEDIQEGAVNGTHMNQAYMSQVTADIVKASLVETEKVVANEIQASEGRFENIVTDKITATEGKFNEIITEKIEAVEGGFTSIKSDVAKINNIISGNISSENIQTGGITGDNLNMETIFVNDANIINVNASKINAGEINTNKVHIQSENGGIVIADNTQQFKDKNGKVRVQIGQDAKGDFNFGVFDETGTGVLIDATGVKEKALADGIIKDRMIGQGEINGSKIDIDSLVTEVNKDTNTTAIKGSKILLDTKGQKLDVAFNSLKTQADKTKKQTESNTTQIGVEQGRINTLIQDTTITKDGQTVKLKDEYSKLEQTVGGIKTSVSQQQTTIDEHTGKITATESKVGTLEQSFNGFRSELSHVKTTVDKQEEAIGSVNSALSGKANSSDVYKKNETMTTSAINSAINQSADSIKLGISNTYETKTNVTNKINSANTTTLNSAKSYADTKKSEAITQAGKDTDSKVNSAKTELNNKIDLKASKTDVYVKSEVYTKSQTDSAIKVAKDEINLSVSNNYETKTNVENKLSNITTTLTNKIDGIQFGGTNIATDTNKGVTGWGWGLQTGGKTITEVTENGIRCCKLARDSVASTGWSYISYNRIGRNKYLPNRKYTVSFEVKASVVTSFYVGLKEGNSSNPLTGDTKTGNTVANTWTKLSATITTLSTLPSSASQILYLNGMSSGTGVTYIFRNLVITEGTKAPSWSPAPEDVDSSINSKASKTDVYTKSETYSKAQTDSAIKVAKDQINLSVSGTYETKTNVSSQVNTALSSAKSYTDTKKNEAILTASTDATNKVNSAKTELNTAINKKANSIDVYTKTQTYTKSETDSAIKVAKDSIELGVKNTYETKSSVESKLSNVTNTLTGKIDAIQIGGRNLAQGASNIYTTAYNSFSGGTNTCPSLAKVLTDGLVVGDTVTVKLIYKYTNIVATSGQTAKCWIQGYGNTTSWNSGTFNSSTQKTLSGSGEHTFLYSFKITPEHLKNSSWSTSIRHDYVQSGSVQWKMFKVEKGNKATDFTLSPEDIDLAINKKANIVDVYKKSETYTKSETDSKINVAKDSINLGVSQTYETKNNVTSKVSSALTSAKNYADTKKTEAINSANLSTDTKLKSYSTTAQMNSAIQVAKDSITNTVSSTYAKKADVESTYATKSSLTQTANNITAKFEASGGYNLLKNSKAKNGTKFWLNNGGGISVTNDSVYEKCFKTQAPSGIRYHESIKLKNNTEYVYEGYIYSRTAIDGSRSAPLHFWCMSTANTSGQSQLTVLDYRQTIPTVNKWTKCYVHFRTASSGDVYFTPFVYVGGSTTFDFWVTELSLSESAVESKWTPHPDEVYSGSTVIDASGVTINNGALTIKNNSGVTVLSGDSNGNLDITGTVKSQKGNMYVSLDYGGVTFQSARNNEQLLRMETTAFSSDKDVNGVDFNLAKYGEYISFNHINKENLNNGWSSSDGRYNFMDFWSKDTTLGSKTYKKGINVNSPMYMNKGLQLYSGSNVNADIDGSVSWNNGTGTVSSLLGMYGDNGAILGYKSGSNLQARFLVTEASHPGTGDNLISWGNYNFNGYTFHNANIVAKSLSVNGSKNCLQETKTYGARLINAYETAEYYFGDLGFGKINEEGVCYVDIDDVFLECVNTNAQYHVFTQVYNGKITSIERYKTYFIVKGEQNTEFSWELKAKRKGYENSRLDTQPIDIDAIDSGLELFTDSDFNAITSEKILINVLEFNLENILLMEE